MKPLRILVLAHEDLLPPESMDGFTDEEIHAFGWQQVFVSQDENSKVLHSAT